MAEKQIKIHNKSDKPDNIFLKEHEIISRCEDIEQTLPGFMRGFFAYLKGNVLTMSRFAYLHDIKFFCSYLIEETDLTTADDTKDIRLEDFNRIKAPDKIGRAHV